MPESVSEIIQVIQWAKAHEMPYIVMVEAATYW